MVARAAIQHWHQKTYRLALIADAHRRAIQRRNQPDENEDTSMTSEVEREITPTMIGILESGMQNDVFKLPHTLGRATGRLRTWGLIKPTGHAKGYWRITDEGRRQYDLVKASQSTQQEGDTEEDGINLDDPELVDDRPIETWEDVAQTRQKIIDDLRLKLDVAEYELHTFQRATEPIKAMMEEDGLGEDLPTYVQLLRERDILARVQWWLLVVNPLIEMIEAFTGTQRIQLMDDPAMIVRYVNTIRQSLQDMDEIADERTRIIEQKDGQIESLNRCIEAQQETINARVASAQGYSALMLSETILDELCDMIPEVGEYRLAREQAVKAISSLKARRS